MDVLLQTSGARGARRSNPWLTRHRLSDKRRDGAVGYTACGIAVALHSRPPAQGDREVRDCGRCFQR